MFRIRSIRKLPVVIFFLSAVLIQPGFNLPGTTHAQIKVNQKITKDPSLKPTPRNFAVPVSIPRLSAVKKGILECGPGGLNCTVMNMPLLNQMDPRLDKDVRDVGPWGCYNTAIVTVILTALANRNKLAAQLKKRTKLFDEIPAGLGERGQTIPKEVAQLSQAYRWWKQDMADVVKDGKPVQVHYFSEVLADLGPIKETCDPYIFWGCAEASNSFGHSFIKDLANSSVALTNEYIKTLMDSGYVLLIAYDRYNPVVITEGDRQGQGKLSTKVSFKFDSHHKVVFSGYQPGSYPLLINDVGNGQQFRVRLATNLSERQYFARDASGKLGTANFKLNIQYPTTTQTFLEYEGTGKGINEQVFFVVHLDALKVIPANPTK